MEDNECNDCGFQLYNNRCLNCESDNNISSE